MVVYPVLDENHSASEGRVPGDYEVVRAYITAAQRTEGGLRLGVSHRLAPSPRNRYWAGSIVLSGKDGDYFMLSKGVEKEYFLIGKTIRLCIRNHEGGGARQEVVVEKILV